MYIDPALLSPLSALRGALIGGGTSLVDAVYPSATRIVSSAPPPMSPNGRRSMPTSS
jgi:hypothetical protein